MKILTYKTLVELEKMARQVEQGDEADPYLLAAAPALAVTALHFAEAVRQEAQRANGLERELMMIRRSLGRVT